MKKSEYELLENQWDADGMIIDDELAERSVLYERISPSPLPTSRTTFPTG